LSIGDATEVPHICQINPILQKVSPFFACLDERGRVPGSHSC
jgi:hypothetical protein